jgi:predicted ArsR family transcriptional regulator
MPAGLSGSRRAVLELLHARSEPTTLNDIVELTGLHENTLRAHLDGLASAGLVRRERAVPDGRGRPAWLWSVEPAGHQSEYAGLASTLAATLSRTSADPTGDARSAGEDWGRALAADRPMSRAENGDDTARAGMLGLLEDLGFAPEGPAERVRLTRCPLLEAARRHPEIVCHVHEGLVEGALAAYGDHTTTAELQPFAEPGACLLLLGEDAHP